MGWNGSGGHSGTVQSAPDSARPMQSARHGIIAKCLAVAVLVVAAAAALLLLLRGREDDAPERKAVERAHDSGRASTNSPAPTTAGTRSTGAAKTAREIAAEFNDQVRPLVKTATNRIEWIVPPADPDDPDNALRTRVSQELGSLLSTEPGDPMPPFPYSFLLEDDMRKAAEAGEEVGEIDNGNKAFLDGLRKFRIAAKEGDDERRLDHKAALLAAQEELLKGMDEGLSVNDSIRAAYEFRKRAYELRTEAIRTMSEYVAAGEDVADTMSVLKQMNAKFAEDGIKAITPEEIGIDEEPEGEGQQANEEESRQ